MRHLISRFFAALLALVVPGWAQSEAPPYSKEQLDQLLAPVALYADSLLAQLLMAAAYPAQVAEAANWSAANPNVKGDAAVTKAEAQGWEPSVTSLVAFAQVLATMGQKPEWVQGPAPQQTVIVIEPAQPQGVYVPTYIPTVAYGAWPYPAYPRTTSRRRRATTSAMRC